MKRFIHLLIWTCISLFITTNSHAQIIKCTLPNGKVIFSDKPCSSGSAQKIDKYASDSTPFVKGSLSSIHNKKIQVVDGVAYWTTNKTSLIVLLSTKALNEEDQQTLIKNKSKFLENDDVPGYVEVELKFKQGNARSKDATRYIRVVTYGLGKTKKTTPWTSGHSTKELNEVIERLEIQNNLDTTLIEIKYNELSDHIHWRFNFRLKTIQVN